VKGVLARLADNLAVVEHGAIGQNDARGQTQATSQHPIVCRGLTEILDQIGGQNQSDVAIDRSRQRWEQFLPVLFRSGRKGPVATN